MIGSMPFFVAMLALLMTRQRLRMSQYVGFALLLAGLIVFIAFDTSGAVEGEWRGHALFLLAALMWAIYTIAMRKKRNRGIACRWRCLMDGPLALVLIIYLSMGHPNLSTVQWRDVGYQAAAQKPVGRRRAIRLW